MGKAGSSQINITAWHDFINQFTGNKQIHQNDTMPTALIVGATRGLGYELAKHYAEKGYTTHGTARSDPPKDASSDIKWIKGVDVSTESAGKAVVDGLKGEKPDVIFFVAGTLPKESIDKPDFDAEVSTYKICSIGPVFVVSALYNAGLFKNGSKLILLSSEGGSITLRHPSEGGGMYSHHASKAALNMVGKLLSMDLKDTGVAVGMIHPGFMRTEMTRSVGFDKFWDEGGAVTPDVAAKKIVEWAEGFEMSKSGRFWAPRGPK